MVVRVLRLQTKHTDPVACRAHLVVRARPEKREMRVTAGHDALVILAVAHEVVGNADVVAEDAVRLPLAVDEVRRCEKYAVFGVVADGHTSEAKIVVGLVPLVGQAKVEDVFLTRGVGDILLVVQVNIRTLAAHVEVIEAADAPEAV